jgi:hypothetical protein
MTLAKSQKALRMGVGKRSEQDGVYNTEDGGIGADAERESENRDNGEARFFEQHSRAKAEILND